MERRLPLKSPQLPENYPSGCRWGLMSFFKLFNGHSSQKLISNARHFDRDKKGKGSARGRPKLLPASDKKYQDEKRIHAVDPRFASVYNSRRGKHEEYFSNSLGYFSEKTGKTVRGHEHSTNHEKCAKVTENSQLRKFRPSREGRQKFYRTDSTNRASHSSLTEVFCGFGCRDIGCVNNGAAGSKAKSARVIDTPASVVNQKLPHRENHKSKELLELLEILNFNEELFLRLLEDPNSLLARQVKDLRGSQEKRPRTELFVREHEGNDDRSYRTQKDLSLCRIKPRESSTPRRNRYTRPLNRIVVLKPQSEFGMRSKVQTVRQSYFPSRRLRRKFRWTRQKKCMPSSVEAGAASSCEVSSNSSSTINLPSNKDCERRREQLIELSNWRDEIKKSPGGKFQKNLRRSISLPGYEVSSFLRSERSRDYGSVGPQMRFCPYGSYRVNDGNEPTLLRETKCSLSSLLDVETLPPEYDKSEDESTCLNTDTETQEIPTNLVHMSSQGSEGIEISQVEHSSSPGNIREHGKSVICSTVEDQVDQLEYDETDWVRCHSGSGTVAGELNNDLQSAIDYVRAVLVTADLDWDRFLVNSHASQQILRPSLFNELKIHCDGSDINQRLLYDYVNAMLEEVHCRHQMDFRTFTVEKNATHAVMKRVHRDRDQLLQKGSPTLEQLVRKDLAYFIKWIDISSNTEEIVTELVDDILDDIAGDM